VLTSITALNVRGHTLSKDVISVPETGGRHINQKCVSAPRNFQDADICQAWVTVY
jgi:hypothetical protein